jgi:hypothetical protein
MCSSNGVFQDKVDYFGHMGKSMGMAATLIRRNYPSVGFPNFVACVNYASQGTLAGTKKSLGSTQFATWAVYNEMFPSCAAIGIPWITSLPTTDPFSPDKLANGNVPFIWGFLNDSLQIKMPSKPTGLRIQ